MAVECFPLRRCLFPAVAVFMLVISLINIYLGTFGVDPDDGKIIMKSRNGRDDYTASRLPLNDDPAVIATNPVPRPPLDSILQGKWNITGDSSWLLNFAIVGFPKCGTSTLMFHLQDHPEIDMFTDERCENGSNQHAVLLRDLYEKQLPSIGQQNIRGIKCPSDLENTALSMRNYRKFFGQADFIVGVRHPVLWFESFYNFRVHNKFKILPPTKLVGGCGPGTRGVCTNRAAFHIALANLGKTNITTDTVEQSYVQRSNGRKVKYDVIETTRKVFFYEVRQLSDSDEGREARLRKDLQTFLHLKEPIKPIIWFKPGKNHSDTILAEVNEQKIDICHDEFQNVRNELMQHAISASRWIRKYFIHAPDVVVSSKEELDRLLLEWETDPCIERWQKQKKQEHEKVK